MRPRFDRKIADFVICDRRSLAVVALVELDDATHSASVDRTGAMSSQAAGYQTLRFPSKQKPTQAKSRLFEHARAWLP